MTGKCDHKSYLPLLNLPVFTVVSSLASFVLAVFPLTLSPAAAVEVQFDYSYDTLGFLDDPERREVLELAASLVNRFVDDLAPIEPANGNSWSIFPALPPNGANRFVVDQFVPAKALKVIVGGNDILPGLTLAQTNIPGPIPLAGPPEWEDTISFRGQTGASQSPATDYGPWGGVMMFNADPKDVSWHFGITTDGLDATEWDFLTVAAHELMHIFGFGPSESFEAYTSESSGSLRFAGPEAVAVGSANNAELKLNDGGHWAVDTQSGTSGLTPEAIMGPIIKPGMRRFPTELDRAALRDVGWDEALPGDANLDRQFDAMDIVNVLEANAYLRDRTAGWAEGDWNGDLVFNQLDIVKALQAGVYLTGPYSAVSRRGSGAEIDVPGKAPHVGSTLDMDGNTTVFSATLGSASGASSLSHSTARVDGSLSVAEPAVLGAAARTGERNDLNRVLLPIPEPSAAVLVCLGLFALAAIRFANAAIGPIGRIGRIGPMSGLAHRSPARQARRPV